MTVTDIRQTKTSDAVADEPSFVKYGRSIAEGHGFTCAEETILDLLLRGCTDAAIANKLQISESAARYRCRKIMHKLGAGNRRDILRRVDDWDLAVSRLLESAASLG